MEEIIHNRKDRTVSSGLIALFEIQSLFEEYGKI